MNFTTTNLIASWVFMLLIPSITSGFDYCKISNVHTMCVYKAISKNCVQYKTQNEIAVRRIINDHNMARSKFAGGHKGYFIPNMMKMYWDQELADLSARWACQCRPSLDDDRGVSRFEVGQVVWTVMQTHNFSRWTDIWKYIIKGGTGFYQRDNWGRMITNYDPADPLSLIYNPSVRFMGCTLAKYLIWSVEVSSFAYTTTLVCNYGPVEDSYEKYPKEDWPCRDCPQGKPCFAMYYMRGNIMPPNLPNERNLCIDPQLEYQHPRPGMRCPVDLQDAAQELHIGDRVPTSTPSRQNYSRNHHEQEPEMSRKMQELGRATGAKVNGTSKKLTHSSGAVETNVRSESNKTWHPAFTNDTIGGDYDNPEEATVKKPFDLDPEDYEEPPRNNSYSSKASNQTTESYSKQHSNVTTTAKSTTTHGTTLNFSHRVSRGDINHGEHDPNEEIYDYHSAKDMDGHINYCELSCVVHVRHTLCLYHETSPDCGQFTSLSNTLTDDDLLHLHNEFRDAYTEGKAGPPHPLASNMVRMQWSKELKKIADMWLRQCKLEHDGCRDAILKNPATGKDKIFRVSQNVGWKYYNLNEPSPSHRDLFEQWKSQAANFTFTRVADYLSYKECGHPKVADFVQLIWARTHYIGCAYGSFIVKNATQGVAMLVCNYAPMGKEVGKHIYIPGGPCSYCFTETDFKLGRCSLKHYPNLCKKS